MAIDYQIKDEKLQYDINREPAQISALSSGKIDNLTAEQILSSTQNQVIEQAKFTYSPLGKIFWKTNKNNWRSRKKQFHVLKNIQDLKDNKEKEIKAIEDKSDAKLSIQEKKFNKLLDERMYEMQKMSGDIEFNNLTYYFKSQNLAPLNFIGYSGLLNIYEEIKNGKISIKKAKEYQKKLISNLNKTTNNIRKSKTQRDISIKYIKNIGNLYNSRQNTIHLLNDYAKIWSETMFKAKYGTGEYRHKNGYYICELWK